MKESTHLELLFKDQHGKNSRITVAHPKEGLNRSEVEAAMTTIKDQNLFAKEGADLHDTIVGARYVSRTVTDVFSAEA